MVVASTDISYLLFFNRTNQVSRNYVLVASQTVSYQYPHGFWYVNDSYFYLISWQNNDIYSYSAVPGNSTWKEKRFLNTSTLTSSSGGNHFAIDECDRWWVTLGSNGLYIYQNRALLQRNFTRITAFMFDIIITDNYVIYLSDTTSSKVIRMALNVTCSYGSP